MRHRIGIGGGRPWTRDEWIGAGIYASAAGLGVAMGVAADSTITAVAGIAMLAWVPFVPSMRRPRRATRARW